MDVWRRGLSYRTCITLQFTGSATPPDFHLKSFYVGVLPGLPPRKVIEGLGTRLPEEVLDVSWAPCLVLYWFMSCLHYQMATYGGNDRILSLLLENSANPNIQVRITINKLLHSTLFCLVCIHILIWLVVHFVHGTVSTHHVLVGLQWNESSSFSSHGRPYQLFDSSLGFPCPRQLHGLLWGKVCLFTCTITHWSLV